MMYIIAYCSNLQQSTQRRKWVRPANLSRNRNVYYINNNLKLKAIDPEACFKHRRMTRDLYDKLLCTLKLGIKLIVNYWCNCQL